MIFLTYYGAMKALAWLSNVNAFLGCVAVLVFDDYAMGAFCFVVALLSLTVARDCHECYEAGFEADDDDDTEN